MSLEEQQSSERYENWRKATLATKCLKRGITGSIDGHVKQQHNDMLSNIQKQFGIGAIACKSCSFKTVLPMHSKDTNGKCPLGNSDCNCLNTKGRKVCPTKFCSVMYEQIILQHRYRSPNWTNTDITQWHENHWEIGKCYISVNGYKKKSSAEMIDCSGLIHVVINDMAIQSSLDCVIDPPNDVFSKTREARNEVMHSADMELDDTDFKRYIEDMITILEDKKLFNNRPEALTAKTELQRLKEGNVKIPKCPVCDDGKNILAVLNQKKQDVIEAIETTTQRCIAKVRSIRIQNVTKQATQEECKYFSNTREDDCTIKNMIMEEDDFSISTRSLVTEYLTYQIQKAGFDYQVSPTRNCPDNKVIDTVKKLCVEFKKRYGKRFTEMCSACAEVDLTFNNYKGVLDQLIVDGLHWSRIVAIFSFAGAMSVHCMKNGQKDRIDWIQEWTSQFIDNKVENWINENNGWKGLVDFYNNVPQKQKERENGWGSLLIHGTLGFYALGALIMQKA